MQGDFLINLDDRSGVSSRMLRLAAWVARIALALVFLSLVTERLGPSGTTGTETTLHRLLPRAVLGVGTWIATVVEILLVLALLSGWQLRWSALLGAIVLFLHALVLCVSLGLIAPPSYFAFAAASAAFLLFATQSRTSV